MTTIAQPWVFYYKKEQYGERNELVIRNCKQPERTKHWKQLVESLHSNEVNGIGYMLLKNWYRTQSN